MLAAIMGGVGGGFGVVYHLFFVSPSDINDESLARKNIFVLCLATLIIFTILFIITLLIFREKAPTPPT